MFVFFLAVLCGMQDFSSLTRDRTRAPCSGSAEPWPLDCQGSCLRKVRKWVSWRASLEFGRDGQGFVVIPNLGNRFGWAPQISLFNGWLILFTYNLPSWWQWWGRDKVVSKTPLGAGVREQNVPFWNVSLTCGLFRAEKNQGPEDSGGNSDLPPNCLKEFT